MKLLSKSELSLAKRPALHPLVDNDRNSDQTRPIPNDKVAKVTSVRGGLWSRTLGLEFSKDRFSNPLKSPLTRSITSTTSSWLSSSWKPAAKLVIHETKNLQAECAAMMTSGTVDIQTHLHQGVLNARISLEFRGRTSHRYKPHHPI